MEAQIWIQHNVQQIMMNVNHLMRISRFIRIKKFIHPDFCMIDASVVRSGQFDCQALRWYSEKLEEFGKKHFCKNVASVLLWRQSEQYAPLLTCFIWHKANLGFLFSESNRYASFLYCFSLWFCFPGTVRNANNR